MSVEYSATFNEALGYAADAHRGHLRKGTEIPYLGHLLGVASIVIDNGGTETEAIAALLHDAPEDRGGQPRLDDIRVHFGSGVADIVEGCSDTLVQVPEGKPPWKVRKNRYIQHLEESKDISIYLVSAADKLHNARSILDDYREIRGRLWDRFDKDAGMDGVLWYYDAMVSTYLNGPEDSRRERIQRDLAETVREIHSAIAERAWPESRQTFEKLLFKRLREIGAPARKVKSEFDYAGMPSEYRGALISVLDELDKLHIGHEDERWKTAWLIRQVVFSIHHATRNATPLLEPTVSTAIETLSQL